MQEGVCREQCVAAKLRAASCPLHKALLGYRRHLRCQHQLMDPSGLLPKVCRMRFELKRKTSPTLFHTGPELPPQSVLLVPVRVEDASLLLSCCEHDANNPCVNPDQGPAFGHRAVIVQGCRKHHASLGWGGDHVDLLVLTWGKKPAARGGRDLEANHWGVSETLGCAGGQQGGLFCAKRTGPIALPKGPEGVVQGCKDSLASSL